MSQCKSWFVHHSSSPSTSLQESSAQSNSCSQDISYTLCSDQDHQVNSINFVMTWVLGLGGAPIPCLSLHIGHGGSLLATARGSIIQTLKLLWNKLQRVKLSSSCFNQQLQYSAMNNAGFFCQNQFSKRRVSNKNIFLKILTHNTEFLNLFKHFTILVKY